MRPLSLTLSGFRSFRAEQTIDFADLGLFAVVGDTGAGKSSILEAMVYALFNASTWNERDIKALIALESDTMRVDLAFSVGEKRYRVTRSASRVPGRTSLHALRCADAPELRFDGERAVNDEIRRVIGLDYATFTKTVVLPQGRFADLLTAKDADRTRALTDLLGLDEIDRIREALTVPHERVRELCTALHAKREDLGADPRAELQRVREQFAGAKQRADVLSGAVREVDTALEARRDAEGALARSKTLAAARAGIVEDATRMLAVAELDHELEKARRLAAAYLEDRVRDVSAATAACEEALARGLDRLGLARVGAAVERLGRDRDALERDRDALERERRAIDDHDRECCSRSALLAPLQNKFETARATLTEAETALRHVSQRERAQSEAWATCAAARRQLLVHENERRQAEYARNTYGLQIPELRETARATAAVLGTAEQKLDAVKRKHAAADLARGLCAGALCPVCARALPADFHANATVPFSQVEADVVAARAIATVAAEGLQTAEHQRVIYERDIERARRDCSRAQRTLETARGALTVVGLDVSTDNESPALANVREEVARCQHVCAERRHEVEVLRDKVSAETASTDALERSVKDDRARVAAAALRAEETARRLEAVRMQVPEPFRPAPELTDADIARRLAAIDEAAQTAHAIDLRFNEARRARDAADEALRELKLRRFAEVVTVVRERVSGIARILLQSGLQDVADASQDIVGGLENSPSAAAGECSPAFAWAEVVRRRSEDAAQRDALACEKLRRQCEAADERQRAALVATDVPDVAALMAATTEASAQRVLFEERVRVAEESVAAAVRLDERLVVAEPLLAALERLRGYLVQSAFKQYAMARRERRLLGVANETLRAMTGGRYAFAERFQILDAHTQATRAPLTLSGGEKFLASLALALGLVEIASQGGGRLDALFLDEGFGNLDAASLDEALDVLGHRASGGKMIGVITHVRGIAAEIEDVLRVRRLASGSIVERLDPTEREKLFDDEVTAGLLEAAG